MLPRSLRALVLSAGAALALAGCQENLAGGAACPALCPDTLTIKDTVLFAAQALDTDLTVPGSPPLGTELALLVANYEQGGDRLVTGVVLRFDSLQRWMDALDFAGLFGGFGGHAASCWSGRCSCCCRSCG